MNDIEVTIRVRVGDDEQEFTATASTTGNRCEAAASLTSAVRSDACSWLTRLPRARQSAAVR